MVNKNILMIFGLMIFVGMIGVSAQEYRMNIKFNQELNSNGNIVMEVSSPPDSVVDNPIDFDIDVDYNGTIDCRLKVDDDIYLLPFSSPQNVDFNSGDVDWKLECWDNNDVSINNSNSGSFKVANFSINGIDDFYLNSSSVSGTVEYQGNFNLKLMGPLGNQIEIKNSASSNDGNFKILSNLISAPGKYTLTATTNYYEKEISTSKIFYVGYGNVKFGKTSVGINEDVDIKIFVDTPEIPRTYSVEINDKTIPSLGGSQSSSKIDTSLKYSSSNVGTDYVNLVLYVGMRSYKISGSNSLKVSSNSTSVSDDKDPVVDLVYPAWEEVIRTSTVEFVYKVTDDVDLAECKLKIFNASKSMGGYVTDELIFPLSSQDSTLAKTDPLGKSDTIKLKLVDFDEGDYIWEVRCEDGAGNNVKDFNYFVVDLGTRNYSSSKSSGGLNYARESEVNDLIKKINNFIENEKNLGIEESKAMKLMGIDSDMSGYKRKLIQIDQDLKYNLKFMDAQKYENRIREIDNEIDEIMDGVVVGIEVGDSYEYSKSSLDSSIEDIISRYFEARGQNVKSATIKSLTRSNTKLQEKISSRVETLKLEIEYGDRKKELVLVNKRLDLDDSFEGVILEIIPEDISKEVTFISEGEDLGDGIWEIDLDKLENNEIIYYFYSDLSLQKIEKTESLLFSEEKMEGGNFITGFVIGIGDNFGGVALPFFVGFLFMGYVGFLLFEKIRLEMWKKEPNVVRILDLIKNTRLLLKENNVLDARENYRKMGEIYKVLPSKCKMYFFNEIKMVRLSIDKKDVLSLIREYEKAKSEGRKDDAAEIHNKISEIYKKLPKKFQDRVYQRLIKNEVK